MDAVAPPAPSLDWFTGLRGERFAVSVEAEPALLNAELREAEPLPQAPFNGRAAFSLVFAGPPAPLLPQRIYRLAHARLPPLEIFLVPVAADAAGVSYQAVFS